MSTHFEGTLTSEGFIPHLKVNGIRLPVALRTVAVDGDERADGKVGRQIMITDNGSPIADYAGYGQYFFATPGGGRIRASTPVMPRHIRAGV